MADKETLLPIEVQHELLSETERTILMDAITNATVQGHAGFTRVMLTIMGFTVGGRVTVAQAEVLTKQAELLFTNLCAQNIQQARDVGAGSDEDPLVAAIQATKRGGQKVRPSLLLSGDGADSYGLEVLDRDGNPIQLKR